MRAPHSQTDRESSDALKCLDRKGEDQIVEEREALQRIDRRRELVAKEVPARGELPGVEVVGRCGRRDARLGEPPPRHRDRPERALASEAASSCSAAISRADAISRAIASRNTCSPAPPWSRSLRPSRSSPWIPVVPSWIGLRRWSRKCRSTGYSGE